MSILGACIGDAAGATLEFMRRLPTTKDVTNALTMPGGGIIGVDPGQITDDGELTLALYKALTESQLDVALILKNIIKAYNAWYLSKPFDCGGTCEEAFKLTSKVCDNSISINSYLQLVEHANSGSEANGALMRASAISQWAHKIKIDPKSAAKIAILDSRITHPSKICQDCNALYVYASTLLLQGNKDVWPMCISYVNENGISDIVKKWMIEDSKDISDLVVTKQIGHVRWGFTMAMHFVRSRSHNFEDALKIVLLKGGDTDTNAAIVGGILGTYLPIPTKLSHPVLSCKVRPAWLQPSTYITA